MSSLQILYTIIVFLCDIILSSPWIPYVDEASWINITINPNLGNITGTNQQPVDFSVWEALDGSYQLEACIRNTKIGGHTRLFYRWEQSKEDILTNKLWEPMGISQIANTEYGESLGGLQAPHVTKWNNTFHKYYGVWIGICHMISKDGKNFTHILNPHNNNSCIIFGNNKGNPRDPMFFTTNVNEADNDHTTTFHLIYSAIYDNNYSTDGVWSRIFTANGVSTSNEASNDLSDYNFNGWSDKIEIAVGGNITGSTPYSAECPFVFYHAESGYYYLFRTQHYTPNGGTTTIFASKDPMSFGKDVPNTADNMVVTQLNVCAPELLEINGQLYIFSLRPDLTGHRFAKLMFKQKHKIDL